jgi:hypothetical protein
MLFENMISILARWTSRFGSVREAAIFCSSLSFASSKISFARKLDRAIDISSGMGLR